MIPDINFVKTTFHHFNSLIFNNKLPIPLFSLTKARTFRGKLAYKRQRTWRGYHNHSFELRISVSFDSTEREWEDVVIHEMIHLAIASEEIEDQSAHGPEFRYRMADINRRFNRALTISSHATPEEQEADTRIRAHYLCIAKLSDGRYGVAPVAKSRIFELWDVLEKFPGAEGTVWLGSTDPWFNRFPRVLKPKFYLADKKDLALHLFNALSLERKGRFLHAVSPRCNPVELLP